MFGKDQYGLKPPLEHSDLPKYVYTTRVTKLTRCHIYVPLKVCVHITRLTRLMVTARKLKQFLPPIHFYFLIYIFSFVIVLWRVGKYVCFAKVGVSKR